MLFRECLFHGESFQLAACFTACFTYGVILLNAPLIYGVTLPLRVRSADQHVSIASPRFRSDARFIALLQFRSDAIPGVPVPQETVLIYVVKMWVGRPRDVQVLRVKQVMNINRGERYLCSPPNSSRVTSLMKQRTPPLGPPQGPRYRPAVWP